MQLAETDIAAQARQTAAQVARGAQAGAKGAADGFNRFVEGTDGPAKRSVPLDESKKDFWDSFADAGAQKQQQQSQQPRGAVGTASIKKPATPMGPGAKEEDKWDAW